MNNEPAHAYHGSEWVEHEDYLVGNRHGLELLRDAINEALEHGESKICSGDFIGVRCLDSEFFEQPARSGNTLGSYIGFSLIAIAFVATVIIVWLSATS